MKKLFVILTCLLGSLMFTSPADAGYRRTIMGYDSRGNPIFKVVWVADHLDYPRTVYERRTYSTSLRRDPTTLVPSYPSLSYRFSDYPIVPVYSASKSSERQ